MTREHVLSRINRTPIATCGRWSIFCLVSVRDWYDGETTLETSYAAIDRDRVLGPHNTLAALVERCKLEG